MKLFVLAGGFGSRLQSVVSDVPKALAPIGSVPFLKLQIVNWKKQGIKSFVFLLHHQADLIISFLKNEQESGVLSGCEVNWFVESIPLDTGGAVACALKQMSIYEDFLVTNADTWLGSGVRDVLNSLSPVMAVVKIADVTRYGCVQFDSRGLITLFREKGQSIGAGWIYAGICKLNVRSFQDWDRLPFSLEKFTFPAMVQEKELRVVTLHTDFIDIGIPADYFRFCNLAKSNKLEGYSFG